MGSVDETEEGALSDFDEDEELDAAPVELPPIAIGPGPGPAAPEVEDERKSLKELAAELEVEKKARKVLEIQKAEGDANFVRLKALITEAARQRDEAYRARDQAARQVEDLLRERDESVHAKEEVIRVKDAAKSEIGEVARMLVSANEKITSMASSVKSFGRNLPASKYTGLQAIAFGFGKRVEEIVEELLKQREAAIKAHREVHDQMEQRNYSIAIEISEMEASISQLKNNVAKSNSELEKWKDQATRKDDMFLELEQVFSEKLSAAETVITALQQSIQEVQGQVKGLTDEAGQSKEVLRDALKCIGKLRKCLLELPHEESGEPESAIFDENVDEKQSMPERCLTELKALLELGTRIGISWKGKKEEWEKTSHEQVTRIGRLVGQKQDAAELLATALSEKQQVLETISDLRVKLSQENLEVERLQASLKEAQELADKGRVHEEENEELARIRVELSMVAQARDEALSKVTALESEVNQLRQQIGDLETTLAQARSEVGELRTLSNGQSEELAERAAQIKDILLQVDGKTADIEALEEEVERWKQATADQTASCNAVMEDLERCRYEVSELNKQIDRLKHSGEEVRLKLRSKEEMAAAAIVARTAAERSLQMADERAAELRHRLEELNRQMEDADRNKEFRLGLGWLDMCCPWLRNRRRSSGSTEMAAEMEELLEPLV